MSVDPVWAYWLSLIALVGLVIYLVHELLNAERAE